jgi:predicted transcriptional regulator
MTTRREKFSSQADPQLLAALREVAKREGRQFQAVLEDAMRTYIESRTQQKSRDSVMEHTRPVWRRTDAWANCWPNDS